MRLIWKKRKMPSDDQRVWDDWSRLHAKYHNQNPMLDRRFVQALLQHFPASVYLLSGFSGSQLAAMILLENANPFRWRSYCPSQMQLTPLLVSPDCDFNPVGLLKACGAEVIRLDLLQLDPLEHMAAIRDLDETNHYGINIQTSTVGDFDNFWQSRSKNLRKNVSRYFNRVEHDNHTIVLQLVRDADDMDAAVTRYADLESNGWKSAEGTAITAHNTQGKFYRTVMKNFSQKGLALVAECYIDGTLVSSRLNIGAGTQMVVLKTAFDETQKQYAVGRLNLYLLLQYLFSDSRWKTVDYYTKATKEQIDWSTSQRDMVHGTIYRTPWLRKLFSILLGLRRFLHRRVGKI